MGLREQAITAWHAWQAERAEKDARELTAMAKAATAACRSMLQVEPDSVRGYEITVDGLRLLYDPRGYFALWGVCPECAAQCWGVEWIDSPEDLGQYLEAFEPSAIHLCHPRVAVMSGTWAACMKALIQEAVEDDC